MTPKAMSQIALLFKAAHATPEERRAVQDAVQDPAVRTPADLPPGSPAAEALAAMLGRVAT